MLDHVGILVTDRERSKRFYAEAVSPLVYDLIMEHHISGVGFGQSGKPEFWIRESVPAAVHVAFAADDRATVDASYGEAIAAGGRDNGRPGSRLEYHPSYYGAFVRDPDGNKFEAVCHKPEKEA